MSDIPDDIMKAVDALLDAAIAANDDVSTEQMMARAIKAERDRCADIVRTMDSNYGALVMRRDAIELIESGK